MTPEEQEKLTNKLFAYIGAKTKDLSKNDQFAVLLPLRSLISEALLRTVSTFDEWENR